MRLKYEISRNCLKKFDHVWCIDNEKHIYIYIYIFNIYDKSNWEMDIYVCKQVNNVVMVSQ